MDEKANRRENLEMPIEKPPYGLPIIFCPSKRAEMPTRRQERERQRAHFYRKQQSGNNPTPVYGFHITTETGERENPGSKY